VHPGRWYASLHGSSFVRQLRDGPLFVQSKNASVGHLSFCRKTKSVHLSALTRPRWHSSFKDCAGMDSCPPLIVYTYSNFHVIAAMIFLPFFVQNGSISTLYACIESSNICFVCRRSLLHRERDVGSIRQKRGARRLPSDSFSPPEDCRYSPSR
jgi:hypothetical protein